MPSQDIYFENRAYRKTVDRLEEITRTFDTAAPDELRTHIVEALGDLGVWPSSCLADPDKGEVILAA